ncbi:hypothetical protein C8R46DRAFT_180340 [Mycena filopes]|nr:hypothetical protein C8R46DRAFT_180340 [Mycena filopes]
METKNERDMIIRASAKAGGLLEGEDTTRCQSGMRSRSAVSRGLRAPQIPRRHAQRRVEFKGMFVLLLFYFIPSCGHSVRDFQLPRDKARPVLLGAEEREKANWPCGRYCTEICIAHWWGQEGRFPLAALKPCCTSVDELRQNLSRFPNARRRIPVARKPSPRRKLLPSAQRTGR